MSPTQTSLAGHPVPSTALLGVLREMAPPKPTPLLPFLLPVNGAYRRKRDIGTNSTSNSSSSRMRIPEKYKPQPDGSWVPAECWDLHGQKWCAVSSSLVPTFRNRSLFICCCTRCQRLRAAAVTSLLRSSPPVRMTPMTPPRQQRQPRRPYLHTRQSIFHLSQRAGSQKNHARSFTLFLSSLHVPFSSPLSLL
jgi:hypothetical protein